MKYAYLLALATLPTAALRAQTTPPAADPAAVPPTVAEPARWRNTLKGALNVNESVLSDNWKAGGVNSIGLSSLLNAKAAYRHERHSWDNEADFLFAFVNNKGQGYRKNLDRFYLDTKYGYQLSQHWNMFVSLNLLSQFAPGYLYDKDANGDDRATLVSDFFAPAFVTAAYGVEFKPSTRFKLRVAPFAPRLTVVSDVERFIPAVSETPYGVNPGHSTRFEVLAAQLLAELDQPLAENVNLKARYVLFGNYTTFTPREVDHRLDLALTAKVNRYVNVSLGGILLYDYDQDRGLQYSQNLTLGVLYTLQNFAEEKK